MDLELFCTVTEFSRISGIPKKSLYNKEANGDFKLIGLVRRGRRNSFIERCIGFGDMVELWPRGRGWSRFDSCYRSELISLFQIVNSKGEIIEGGLAFSIIDIVRILDISKQVVHSRLQSGVIRKQLCRRNFRNFDEWLIMAADLKKIRSEPFNIRERILEMFMEKCSWRSDFLG